MTTRIIDAHDVAFFDLDGVIYLGPIAVPGAVEGIRDVTAAGARVMYVTNNAARSAATVAEHLDSLGFAAGPDDLITSAQVAAGVLAETLTPGSLLLVAGTRNVVDLVESVGFRTTASADDEPDAVLQGYSPDIPWQLLDEAAIAVQRGATWYATNDDATRPTDRGLVAGLGAQVAVVGMVVRPKKPIVFGKPHAPMLDFAIGHTGAERPIFVGDRIDTDIMGANRAGMKSMLVFTGAHGKRDLLAAGPGDRPNYIGADVRALLEPPRIATKEGHAWVCGAARARLHDGRILLEGDLATVPGQFDALWALANLSWATDADPAEALALLDQLH
ncbi:MAG TPA: HAD-IIA family hydrolase [Micropruina sp.]|nr:HAD-IIA family hydrolase [Propionibacterium sp.]HMQ36365.1 HAD-IIA family hydrolase [Micropruina sp.]HMR21284.1 HAD-IIA family hydrolase [Micropruina sp.]